MGICSLNPGMPSLPHSEYVVSFVVHSLPISEDVGSLMGMADVGKTKRVSNETEFRVHWT